MQSLLDKKGGDSGEVIKMLLTENFKLRDDKRTLKGQLVELEKKTPGEGTVILTGDDATEWNSFKELGKKVEEVKTGLAKSEELQGELNKRDRSALIANAAKEAGYNSSVLTELVEARGLTVEMKDIEVKAEDGTKKTEKRPFIKAGEKSDPVELSSYAESNFKNFMPALTNTEEGNQESGNLVPPQRRSSQIPPSKKGKSLDAVKKVTGQYKTPSQLKAEKE
jgi:hypothetical protein